MSHMEQELLSLPEHQRFSGVRVVGSLVLCVVLCTLFIVILSPFVCPLNCVFFCDLRILIIPLVSSKLFDRLGSYLHFTVNILTVELIQVHLCSKSGYQSSHMGPFRFIALNERHRLVLTNYGQKMIRLKDTVILLLPLRLIVDLSFPK